VEEDGPVVLVTHPREALLATGPQHVVAGPDRFHVRIWSASPVAEVRARLDDGPWFPLNPAAAGDWAAPPPGDRLVKREHDFEVEATDRDGRRAARRTSFMVDPTGRYTAVPCVRPRVTRTAFC
jgi:hypothetical protein